MLFQKALVEDPAQAQASQYIHYLRADDAAERMSQDGFRRTFGMLEKFSATAWLDDEEREGYRKAWSQPGRLNAMLNWYRASPIVVPVDGEPMPPTPLKDAGPDRFSVAAPHLLVWGMQDTALLAGVQGRAGALRAAIDGGRNSGCRALDHPHPWRTRRTGDPDFVSTG